MSENDYDPTAAFNTAPPSLLSQFTDGASDFLGATVSINYPTLPESVFRGLSEVSLLSEEYDTLNEVWDTVHTLKRHIKRSDSLDDLEQRLEDSRVDYTLISLVKSATSLNSLQSDVDTLASRLKDELHTGNPEIEITQMVENDEGEEVEEVADAEDLYELVSAVEMSDFYVEYRETGRPVIINRNPDQYTRYGDKLDMGTFTATANAVVLTLGEGPDKEAANVKEEPGDYYTRFYGVPVEEPEMPSDTTDLFGERRYIPVAVSTYSEVDSEALDYLDYAEAVLTELAEAELITSPLSLLDDKETVIKELKTAVQGWVDEYGSLQSIDDLRSIGEALYTARGEPKQIEYMVPVERGEHGETISKTTDEEESDLSEEELEAITKFAEQQKVAEETANDEGEQMFVTEKITLSETSAGGLQSLMDEYDPVFYFDPLSDSSARSPDDLSVSFFRADVFGYVHHNRLVPVLWATEYDGEFAQKAFQLANNVLSIESDAGESAIRIPPEKHVGNGDEGR